MVSRFYKLILYSTLILAIVGNVYQVNRNRNLEREIQGLGRNYSQLFEAFGSNRKVADFREGIFQLYIEELKKEIEEKDKIIGGKDKKIADLEKKANSPVSMVDKK